MDGGSALGQLVQGTAGYTMGQFNKKIAKNNARNAAIEGVAQGDMIRDRARAAMGEQIAEQGASGTMVGTGSNLDALRESAINRELDIMNVRRSAATKSQAFKQQGAIADMQGQMAMAKGIGGAISAMAKGFAGASGEASAAYGDGEALPDLTQFDPMMSYGSAGMPGGW